MYEWKALAEGTRCVYEVFEGRRSDVDIPSSVDSCRVRKKEEKSRSLCA
jgi:hypothetical protein